MQVSAAEIITSGQSLAVLLTVLNLVGGFSPSGFRGKQALRVHCVPARACPIRSGLPGFSSWFQASYSDCYIKRDLNKKDNDRFEHVYVDVQQFIHTAAQRSKNENRCLSELKRLITTVFFSSSPPQRSFTLAVDGPAPLTKVLTQRKRRSSVARRAASKKGNKFDKLKVTAGSSFMAQVHGDLMSYARERFSGCPVLVVDGPLVPGEGEVKMLGHMYRQEKEACRSSLRSPGAAAGCHAFVGADSDLILMAIFGYAQIALSQTEGGRHAVPDVLSFDPLKGNNKFFSASKFAQKLEGRLSEGGITTTPRLAFRAMLDLTCISILASGNDYLPALPGCGGLASIWETYIGWLLRKAGSDAQENVTLVNRLEDSSKVQISWAALASFLEVVDNRTEVQTAKSPAERRSKRRRRRRAILYANALLWNLNMYAQGKCPDYRLGPRILGTSCADLRDFALSQCGALSLEVLVPQEQQAHIPPVPAIFNLLMQPVAGRPLVTPTLRPLMDEDSPIGWLFLRGCRCLDCYDFWTKENPLARAVQKMRGVETMEAEFNATTEQLRILRAAINKHLEEHHHGEPKIFHELPSLSLVERLAHAARTTEDTRSQNPEDYDERLWTFQHPCRFMSQYHGHDGPETLYDGVEQSSFISKPQIRVGNLRHNGSVRMWDGDRNFGFIRGSDGQQRWFSGNEVWCHGKHPKLDSGIKVSYSIGSNPRGDVCLDVTAASGSHIPSCAQTTHSKAATKMPGSSTKTTATVTTKTHGAPTSKAKLTKSQAVAASKVRDAPANKTQAVSSTQLKATGRGGYKLRARRRGKRGE